MDQKQRVGPLVVQSRMARTRGSLLLFGSMYIASSSNSAATTVSSCNVSEMVVQNGGLGDCLSTLELGEACTPRCLDGYSAVGLAVCSHAGLIVPECEPEACNASVIPADGEDMGDCSDFLASGEECQPECAENYTLVTNTSCKLGRLTIGVCALDPGAESTTTTTALAVVCPDGQEWRDTLCQPCPVGTYKDHASAEPCVACPSGAVTTDVGATRPADCTCNSTSYANVSFDVLMACLPCPPYSKVKEPGRLSRRQDCLCAEGYIYEFDRRGELDRCRLPFPCNVSEWLASIDVTGKEKHQLRLGTCANVTVLPHDWQCNLMCDETSAPQLNTDFIRAVDTRVLCNDGTIDSQIQPGTWCSRDAWEMPPIVFLATVTLGSSIAAFFMEWRNHSFERACVQAMRGCMPEKG